jgi:hypothetical protein|tara:strand:- start:1335 stop:1523 length:189 start_codon:yes stop_codon:yes gene_type:complete
MTANQLIKQRDELLSLTKDILSYLTDVSEDINDQEMMEKSEDFQERLNELIQLDELADSSYG